MSENSHYSGGLASAPPSKPEETGDERNGEECSQRPYLKTFGPDIGVAEFELSDKPVTVGRAEEADIRFPDPRVSRAHARITCHDGQYTIEDVGSSAGTKVNRKPVQTHVLQHGDTAQIGEYVLQFRTHHELPGAAAAAQRAKLLTRSDFTLLPSGIQLRYRQLQTAPEEIFAAGDTLRIGQSGLLVPRSDSPGDCVCLEVHLLWGSGRTACYLGEVVGVIEEASTYWMCVKLHRVSKQVYESTTGSGEPGPWVDVRGT